MKIVIQKVKEAEVSCEDCETKLSNKIGKGIVAYVGFSKNISYEKIDKAIEKLLNLRIFYDSENNLVSLKDLDYEILIISNFTLQGILKGRRINYKNSLEAEKAKEMYDYLVDNLIRNYKKEKIKTGFFRKKMLVKPVIEGPFNFVIEL